MIVPWAEMETPTATSSAEHVENLHNGFICRGRNPVCEMAVDFATVANMERRMRHAEKLLSDLSFMTFGKSRTMIMDHLAAAAWEDKA